MRDLREVWGSALEALELDGSSRVSAISWNGDYLDQLVANPSVARVVEMRVGGRCLEVPQSWNTSGLKSVTVGLRRTRRRPHCPHPKPLSN